MKKFIATLIVGAALGAIVFGQDAKLGAESENIGSSARMGPTVSPVVRTNARQTGGSDFKRLEVYLGFSYSDLRLKDYKNDTRLQSTPRLDRAFSTRDRFSRGVGTSFVYNFARFIGAKADFSLNFNDRKATVANRNVVVRERLTNYLVGIQIKDNSSQGSRLRPFASVLAGFSQGTTKLRDCSAFGAVCPGSLNKTRSGFTYSFGGGLDLKVNERVSFRAIQVDYLRGKVTDGLRFGAGIVF